jgi:hypothetical protein
MVCDGRTHIGMDQADLEKADCPQCRITRRDTNACTNACNKNRMGKDRVLGPVFASSVRGLEGESFEEVSSRLGLLGCGGFSPSVM